MINYIILRTFAPLRAYMVSKCGHNKPYIIKTNSIGAALVCLALVSCRDEVILKLNTVGAIPVIECNISNDSIPFHARITTTADYYSLIIPEVQDARVTIVGSDGSLDTLFHDSAGMYYSKSIHPCKIGIRYTLSVAYNGKTYTASEICRPQNPIDSLKMIIMPKRGFLPAGPYLWEWAQEKPGIGDSYQWNIYKNDTLLNEDFYFLNDDKLIDGAYLASDFPFLFKVGDNIVFEQMAISQPLFNFLTTIQSQINRDGSPFSSPPSNISGNMSGGALGFFAVRNLIRKKLTVK